MATTPRQASTMTIGMAAPGTVIQPHPETVRAQAREQQYPNDETAEAHWTAIDSQVFDRVRAHETYLVEVAESHMANRERHVTEAVESIAALREEILYPLLDGALPTEENAARFKKIQALALAARQALIAADKDAAYLATRAADPYASVTDIWNRRQNLRPVIIR